MGFVILMALPLGLFVKEKLALKISGTGVTVGVFPLHL